MAPAIRQGKTTLFYAKLIEPLTPTCRIRNELCRSVAVECLKRLPEAIDERVFVFNEVVAGWNRIDEKPEPTVVKG